MMCDCQEELKSQVERIAAALDEHAAKLDSHIEAEDLERKQMMIAITQNTYAIQQHISETRIIVDFIKDAHGSFRMLNRIQKFVKWLSGFAVIGFVLQWFAKHWH